MIDKEIKASLKTTLRKARRIADMSQREVAEKIGTSEVYYAKIERGEAVPSLKMLGKIVRAIGVSSKDVLPF